tara:strand:+ start:7246 stop:7470 length:225 start_codon:yes stop_codon:yes gene_type:complete
VRKMKNPVKQYFRKYPITTFNGALYGITLAISAGYGGAFVLGDRSGLDRRYSAVTAAAFGLLATSMVMRDLEGY